MSTFGTLFRVTTFGESHGISVGCIIDGCPPGLPVSRAAIQVQLNRRRPGQSALTTERDEKDSVKILSGMENGITLGTPIAMQVMNEDQRKYDYSETNVFPRPSHADLTYLLKYGIKASSGGGRSSARETVGRVAAGSIAETYLSLVHKVEIVAFVASIGDIEMPFVENNTKICESFQLLLDTVTRKDVESNESRCPDKNIAQKMKERILEVKEQKDSIGGTVMCVVRNVPVGLGEPCFDKLEAMLAHAILSIPATKGIEIGSGFWGSKMNGSTHNDPFIPDSTCKEKLLTSTNFSGGIQGGISNGQHIYFRVAFKPAATIGQPQNTSTYTGEMGTLSAKGRHDPCVVPRAVPIVEAMTALVIMDALMIQNSREKASIVNN